MTLEEACVIRDAAVDKLMLFADWRPGGVHNNNLTRYLGGDFKANPNGIPTLLRRAQETVLELMETEVTWKT